MTTRQIVPGQSPLPSGWTWGQIPGSRDIIPVPNEDATDEEINAFLRSKGIPTIQDIKAGFAATHGGATITPENQAALAKITAGGGNQSDSPRFTPTPSSKFQTLGSDSGVTLEPPSRVPPALFNRFDPAQVAAVHDFAVAFEQQTGKEITDDQLSDPSFLAQLNNELLRRLPNSILSRLTVDRLADFGNADLKGIIEDHPEILAQISADRLVGEGKYAGSGFAVDELNGFISKLPAGHASIPGLQDAVRKQGGTPAEPATGAPPAAPGTSPTAPGAPPAAPGAPPAPVVPIPRDTHGWVAEVGAQDWYRRKIAEGLKPDQITQDMLFEDMRKVWETRKDDPKFKAIYKFAQEFFARSGRWPTEVEFNKFTAKDKNIPSILPDGSGLLPKGSGIGGEGARTPWEVPTDPLPPGYEWRFDARGQPVEWKTDQSKKDLFSGWFQNPKTGSWEYDPIAGAADYLQYDKTSQTAWGDLLNAFISKTGRLPKLDEARNMAASLWAGADPATKARAQQFAQMYGHFPTPFELDNGPAKDKDANTGGGGQGAAGQGQVPVFVPGIGTVLVPGESVGRGGFVFDPFQGIPGSVRPWVKELLNGSITLDQIPQEMRAWAGFAINKFQEQLPKIPQEQIPWGVPGPAGTPGPTPLPPNVQKQAGQAQFLTAWKQLHPGEPDPTTEQLNDVGWLSQQDAGASKFLDGSVLKQFPMDKLVQFDNGTLMGKLDIDTVGKLPPSRLAQLPTDFLGKLPDDKLLTLPDDIIAKLPNERIKGFPPDVLGRIITDSKRRGELGLPPAAPGTQPPTPTPPTPTPTPPTPPPPEHGAGLGPTVPPPPGAKIQPLPPPPPTIVGTPPTATPTTPPTTPPTEVEGISGESTAAMRGAGTDVQGNRLPTALGLPPPIGATSTQPSQYNIGALQAAFGAHKGDTAYNPVFDINNDGMIDITDYAAVQKQGASPPSIKPMSATDTALPAPITTIDTATEQTTGTGTGIAKATPSPMKSLLGLAPPPTVYGHNGGTDAITVMGAGQEKSKSSGPMGLVWRRTMDPELGEVIVSPNGVLKYPVRLLEKDPSYVQYLPLGAKLAIGDPEATQRYKDAWDFREQIFQKYGFSKEARDLIRNNSMITIDDPSSGAGGGGWMPTYSTVALASKQEEAALHEFSHVYWHFYRQEHPEEVVQMVKHLVSLADMDPKANPQYANAISFAHTYVYGDGRGWAGMLNSDAGAADPHNITKADFDFSSSPTKAKINDWEIYAGLSSYNMGMGDKGSHALPPDLWGPIHGREFTGKVSGPLYYDPTYKPKPEDVDTTPPEPLPPLAPPSAPPISKAPTPPPLPPPVGGAPPGGLPPASPTAPTTAEPPVYRPPAGQPLPVHAYIPPPSSGAQPPSHIQSPDGRFMYHSNPDEYTAAIADYDRDPTGKPYPVFSPPSVSRWGEPTPGGPSGPGNMWRSPPPAPLSTGGPQLPPLPPPVGASTTMPQPALTPISSPLIRNM